MATASASLTPIRGPSPDNTSYVGKSSTESADVAQSPRQSTSASQSVASTSAVTLDEPVLSNTTSNDATPDASVKVISGDGSAAKEENEDAKLLASLAEGLSNGLHNSSAMNGSSLELSQKIPPHHSTQIDKEVELSSVTGPIQAYAKLEFPGFSYYIQTLDCTIGRRPAYMRHPFPQKGDNQHITEAKKMEGDVDVDLGLLKSISRLHVRIFYQDQPRSNSISAGMPDMNGKRSYDFETGHSSSLNQGRFVLHVLGRNGCFVDDVPAGKDAIVPLGKRTKIQIAERVFYFVLPPAPQTKTYNSDGELDSGESLGESDDASESLGSSGSEEDSSELSSTEEEEEEEEESEEEADAIQDVEVRKRPKLVLRKKPVPPARGGKGKGKHQGKTVWAGKGKMPAKRRKEEGEEEDSEEEGDSEENMEKDETKQKAEKTSAKKVKAANIAKEKSTSGEVAASSRKRKRGEGAEQEQQTALKVGTPIGVEALNLKSSKKKKKDLVEGVDTTKDSSTAITPTLTGKGKGKGAGKAHIVAAAVAAKAKADEERTKMMATANSSSSAAPSKGVSAPNTSTTINSATSAAALARPVATNSNRPTTQPSNPLTSNAATRPPPGISVRPGQPAVRPAVSNSSLPGNNIIRPLAGSVDAQRPTTGIQTGLSSTLQQAGVRPFVSGSSSSTAPPVSSGPAPFPPSAAAFAHLTNQKPPTTSSPNQPLPPAGSGIKPELSNMDLVKNALSNSISISRGGKMTLQEIYEDISSKYEWYRNNNRSNGRDWHSSIRHAVGNSREMVRIPRKSNEQGKGVFYALSSSEAARLHRIEEQSSTAGSVPVQSASPTPPITAVPRPPTSAPAPVHVPVPSAVPSPTPPVARPAAPRPPPIVRPSPPPVQASGRVSIVIGKAPAEALAQMASVPKAAITQSIEVLFGGPPIVHHLGKLYLNPLVFGDMSANEINDIGGKGAQQALAILQSHLVTHLQNKMKPGQSASPRPARPPLPPSAAAAGPGPRPKTMPLPTPRPAQVLNGASRLPVASNVPINRPVPARPGVVSRPPVGTVQPVRPPLPPATPGANSIRPLPPGAPVVNRPMPMSNGPPPSSVPPALNKPPAPIPTNIKEDPKAPPPAPTSK